MENKDGFSFTYSAAARQEIEEIRKKYLPKEEDKMERLRRLHAIPTRKAQTASIAVGIIGTLILGTGMSLIMTDIGNILGVLESLAMLIGILAGLVGMVLIALAYPVYNRVIKKERARIAPEILRLTEELMR